MLAHGDGALWPADALILLVKAPHRRHSRQDKWCDISLEAGITPQPPLQSAPNSFSSKQDVTEKAAAAPCSCEAPHASLGALQAEAMVATADHGLWERDDAAATCEHALLCSSSGVGWGQTTSSVPWPMVHYPHHPWKPGHHGHPAGSHSSGNKDPCCVLDHTDSFRREVLCPAQAALCLPDCKSHLRKTV